MVKIKNMDIEEALKLYEELQERDDVVDLYTSRLIAEMDRRVWEEKMAEDKAKLEEDKIKLQENKAKMEADKIKLQENKAKMEADKIKLQENKAKMEADKIKLQENKAKMEKEKIRVVEENEKKLSQIIRNLLQENLSKDMILNITGVSEERFEKAKLAFN